MNNDKLSMAMKAKGVSNNTLCKFIGISRSALYRKRLGITEFTKTEIEKIVECLGLRSPMEIFFDDEVS